MAKTGGIYKFMCKFHGAFERFCWDGDPVKCECGRVCGRWIHSAKHPGMDYDRPVLSESMGVHPSQVNEHRKLHPNVPMTDDGRVIVRNHSEHKRIAKELGFFDKSGFN
jgi:hypothetical protein